MHRDLVYHRYSGGYSELAERIEPDDPRAEGPDRWKQALSGWATYVFISEPHNENDCPFKDMDKIPFGSV